MSVIDDLIASPPVGVKGTFVDVDKEFGPQCWDLCELYAEKMGVPREPWAIPLGPQGAAFEAWTLFQTSAHMKKYFIQVAVGQQQRGDMGVYAGHSGDTQGHIMIYLGNGQVFQQNAPYGSDSHIDTFTTSYLLGFIRVVTQGGDMAKYSQQQIQILAETATGSYPGKDYNYPETQQDITFDSLNDVLNTWLSRTSVVTPELEQIFAKTATGANYGAGYNSQFQGKPILQVLLPMANFWLSQRTVPAGTVNRDSVLAYVESNLS